ncbi:hypothetical protein V2J09_010565 [Rumex salicifolius]
MKKFFGLFLLFLIVFASGIGINMVQVEGQCTKPSKYYHGYCVSGCTSACKKENWPEGSCVGSIFNLKCVCERPC